MSVWLTEWSLETCWIGRSLKPSQSVARLTVLVLHLSSTICNCQGSNVQFLTYVTFNCFAKLTFGQKYRCLFISSLSLNCVNDFYFFSWFVAELIKKYLLHSLSCYFCVNWIAISKTKPMPFFVIAKFGEKLQLVYFENW
jgi:hypothetical protein